MAWPGWTHEKGEHAPLGPFPETTRALEIKRALEAGEYGKTIDMKDIYWLAQNYPSFLPPSFATKETVPPSPGISLGHEAYEISAIGTPQEQAFVRSKMFYESIGYPEYAGKYDPFETPKGYQIADIIETGEGKLNISFGLKASQLVGGSSSAWVSEKPGSAWLLQQRREEYKIAPLTGPLLEGIEGEKGIAETLASFKTVPLLQRMGLPPPLSSLFSARDFMVSGKTQEVRPFAEIGSLLIAPLERTAYPYMKLIGMKTPLPPPTGPGGLIGKGLSLITGAPSDEWERAMAYGPDYVLGTFIGEALLSFGISKGLSSLWKGITGPVGQTIWKYTPVIREPYEAAQEYVWPYITRPASAIANIGKEVGQATWGYVPEFARTPVEYLAEKVPSVLGRIEIFYRQIQAWPHEYTGFAPEISDMPELVQSATGLTERPQSPLYLGDLAGFERETLSIDLKPSELSDAEKALFEKVFVPKGASLAGFKGSEGRVFEEIDKMAKDFLSGFKDITEWPTPSPIEYGAEFDNVLGTKAAQEMAWKLGTTPKASTLLISKYATELISKDLSEGAIGTLAKLTAMGVFHGKVGYWPTEGIRVRELSAYGGYSEPSRDILKTVEETVSMPYIPETVTRISSSLASVVKLTVGASLVTIPKLKPINYEEPYPQFKLKFQPFLDLEPRQEQRRMLVPILSLNLLQEQMPSLIQEQIVSPVQIAMQKQEQKQALLTLQIQKLNSEFKLPDLNLDLRLTIPSKRGRKRRGKWFKRTHPIPTYQQMAKRWGLWKKGR